MDSTGLLIATAATVIGAFGIWVAILVSRAEVYSPSQKLAQIAIAIIIPLFGAALVHAMLRGYSAGAKDRRFTPDRRDDTATGPHIRTVDDA